MYSTLESLEQLFAKHAKHNMDGSSKERFGFKHQPIGDVEQTTVLHSVINTCRWLLKCIAISNSTYVISVFKMSENNLTAIVSALCETLHGKPLVMFTV